MATTLIENIVNELTELVVQKVLEEFNQRTNEVAARLNEVAARINALEIRNRTLLTEGSLIEFINDRVRLTTE